MVATTGPGADASQLHLQHCLAGSVLTLVMLWLRPQDQARMHLDCIFNVLGKDVVVLAEDVIGDDKPMRRLVTEYVIIINNVSQINLIIVENNNELPCHRVRPAHFSCTLNKNQNTRTDN
jgi:arginine deiminase